jgi:predicted PurR-regulated permease PerM
MKRVIFPDGKLLQPIPLVNGVHANISGNINSVTKVLPNKELAPNISNEQNNISEKLLNTSNNLGFYISLGIIIFLIIFLIFFIYKKLNKKKFN